MFKKIVLVLIVVLLLIPSLTKADGGMMPPPNQWIYETGQKGAIVFQNNTETLVLSTSFQGDAKDFAYIVPTPSKPEVSKVSDDIFTNLEELTQQEYYNTMPLSGGLGGADMAVKQEVTVVEEKQVGIFDIKVLTATGANALFDWLKENNFTYPASKKYILDDYIQNKWYFTTAKISTEAITKDVESKLTQGDLTPLKFTFETQNIVYPLKISAVVDDVVMKKDYEAVQENLSDYEISSKMLYPVDYVPITLYIFADHKKETANFYEDYANWVKQDEIEKLAKDDNGNPWVEINSKKMYLTKLSSSLAYSEMTNDLFFDNADDNDKVGVISWWENVLTWLGTIGLALIFLAFLVLFFILCIWQFKPCSRRCRIACWVFQSISFVLIGLPMLAIFFSLLLANSFYGYYSMYELATMLEISLLFLGLPVLMIILMILEGVKQKNIKEMK